MDEIQDFSIILVTDADESNELRDRYGVGEEVVPCYLRGRYRGRLAWSLSWLSQQLLDDTGIDDTVRTISKNTLLEWCRDNYENMPEDTMHSGLSVLTKWSGVAWRELDV